MHGTGVCLGVYRDGTNVQFLAGPNNANRDLTAICYQNLLKHGYVNDDGCSKTSLLPA